MKKLLGIVVDDDAHFYEVESDELEKFISFLNKKLNYREKNTVLCNYYDSKVHDFGSYQSDINSGKCRVLRSEVISKDIKKSDAFSEDNFKLGIIGLEVEYQSQIAKIIHSIFNSNPKLLDFSRLIKIYDYFRRGDDNALDYLSTYGVRRANRSKKIELNDKEKSLDMKGFSDIIAGLAKCLDFNYVGSITPEDLTDDKKELMYEIASYNSGIFTIDEFKSLRDKMEKNVDVKKLKKS